MNKKTEKISYSLLVLLLVSSSFLPIFLLDNKFFDNVSVIDLIIISAFYCLIAAACITSRNRYIDLNNKVLKAVVYVMFFLLAFKTVSSYSKFFIAMINPNANVYICMFLLILTSVYAAIKDSEGLTRSSIIIVSLCIATLVLLILGAVPNIDFKNINSIANNGISTELILMFLSAVLYIFPAALIFQRNSVKRKRNLKIYIPAFTAVVALIVMCCIVLGKFTAYESFPMFSMFRYTAYSLIDSISGVCFIVITLVCTIQLALFLCANKEIYGNKSGSVVVYINAILIFAAFIISTVFNLSDSVYKVFDYITLALEIIISVVLLIGSRKRDDEK